MALDQHGVLLKMVVIVSQHHLTGRLCWSWLSWFICLSTRLWGNALLLVQSPLERSFQRLEVGDESLDGELRRPTPGDHRTDVHHTPILQQSHFVVVIQHNFHNTLPLSGVAAPSTLT